MSITSLAWPQAQNPPPPPPSSTPQLICLELCQCWLHGISFICFYHHLIHHLHAGHCSSLLTAFDASSLPSLIPLTNPCQSDLPKAPLCPLTCVKIFLVSSIVQSKNKCPKPHPPPSTIQHKRATSPTLSGSATQNNLPLNAHGPFFLWVSFLGLLGLPRSDANPLLKCHLLLEVVPGLQLRAKLYSSNLIDLALFSCPLSLSTVN